MCKWMRRGGEDRGRGGACNWVKAAVRTLNTLEKFFPRTQLHLLLHLLLLLLLLLLPQLQLQRREHSHFPQIEFSWKCHCSSVRWLSFVESPCGDCSTFARATCPLLELPDFRRGHISSCRLLWRLAACASAAPSIGRSTLCSLTTRAEAVGEIFHLTEYLSSP